MSSNNLGRVSTIARGGVSIDFGRASLRRMRGAVSVTQLVVAAILIALIGFVAWWFLGQSGTSITATAPSTTAAPGTTAAPAPTAAEDLTVDQLYKEARVAMGENRMVAPTGNNALEYYLRILAKQPDDTGATDALRELFPFATGSAEDQINQGNFDEANRIMGLLAKADPSNYTLTILRSKLDAKKKQNDREQQQAQQAATAAAAAAARAQAPAQAGAATPESTAAAGSTAAPAAETPGAAAPKQTVARATPTPTVAPPPAASPEQPVGETRDVRVVTPPRPSYPAAAARNRQDGWVEVEFTVAADGSVQNARVVGANPARLFDREAVRAIEQAKFEPRLDKGQAVATTMRRRIEFKLGQ
ncbi:energy transducer TonB [Dokdonella soli]|uniref:energy transducer TonB n=1 Tax=Dokdonella soli TaxID=529810 RepID=UPI0031D508D9